ncbi:MAG: phytanoyl-CoA dioxygenase family protein [Gammaproteobacteria bacterium]|nr:phytanoyl-CoA dioxygenase family protein [Gammaproteobacteria bacterium]
MLEALRENGFCIVPDVLEPSRVAEVRERLLAAAEASERRGVPTRMPALDPNAHNIRVFHLLELNAIFRELIRHPQALALVQGLLGDDFLISNFTANIALPGSGSMALHSDQALVVPEPWLAPWSMNIIWCLDDLHEGNGATRYLPDSHRITSLDELPADARSRLAAFTAPAGSIIAMDGRVWHTSGANITAHEERALLFGYYSVDFLRPQVNWNAVLSPEVQAELDADMRRWLGLEVAANFRTGGALLARNLGQGPG